MKLNKLTAIYLLFVADEEEALELFNLVEAE